VNDTPWHLAALKLRTRELAVSAADRARLKAILKQKNWRAPLLKTLQTKGMASALPGLEAGWTCSN
jgi:hypothetical protein